MEVEVVERGRWRWWRGVGGDGGEGRWRWPIIMFHQ